MFEKIGMIASAITLILLVTDGIVLRKKINELEERIEELENK